MATASNPLTIASWAAVFGAASAGSGSRTAAAAVVLVLGVGLGSLAWHVLLVAGMRLLRRRVGDRTLRAVDAVAGGALLLGGVGLGRAGGPRSVARHVRKVTFCPGCRNLALG